MNGYPQVSYRRALFSFVLILVVFLAVSVVVILSHQREMLDDMKAGARRELALLGTLSRESLLKLDYATVEKFLLQWAEEHENVIELKAVAPNNFVLAEYKREVPAAYTYSIKQQVRYKGRDLVTLYMTRDLTAVAGSLDRLALRLIAGSVLLTVLLGTALWFALRRMALLPLERRVEERTAELARSNVLLRQEIAERQRAEESLKEERDRAQRYLDISGVMFVVIGADQRVALINRKGCEILGYEEGEVVGKNWFDNFLPEGIRDKVKGVFEMLMAGEVELVEYFENPVLDRNGQERVIAWHNTLLRDEEGNIQATLSSGEDITERKRAEEELRTLFSTLDTVVEHMPEGVVLLEEGGRVVLANPVGREHLSALSERGVGEVLTHIGGRPLKELLVSPPLIAWHDVQAGGRTYEVAGRAVAAGGTVFVMRDVTEERALKERIQLHERLASVGQMAAGIAHDFNNILTIINGYAEILLTDTPLSQEARQEVGAIFESGQRATSLIGQMLDFSRRKAGELEVIDLLPFVKEFTRFIERAIPVNIRLSIVFEPGDYKVRADPTRIQQVLANLAVNARDSMPEGGELRFGISRMSLAPGEKPPLPEMPPGGWVVLSVADTGTGIAPEVLPHIFEPFFTTKGVGKGSGLGLSQVYGIVKQHGGYINVKTSSGKGSVFLIYLPEAKGPRGALGEAREGRGRAVQGARGESTPS